MIIFKQVSINLSILLSSHALRRTRSGRHSFFPAASTSPLFQLLSRIISWTNICRRRLETDWSPSAFPLSTFWAASHHFSSLCCSSLSFSACFSPPIYLYFLNGFCPCSSWPLSFSLGILFSLISAPPLLWVVFNVHFLFDVVGQWLSVFNFLQLLSRT